MFSKVLVPIDASETAPGILPYVSYLARSMGIPVLLMSAVDSKEPIDDREPLNEDSSILGSVVQAADDGRELLRGFLEPLIREGIEADGEVSFARDPAVEILDIAQRRGCDLIAMATHDRNLLGQAVKGSVTNQVLRSARVPVLAVTPERSSRQSDQELTISSIVTPLDGSSFAESVLPYVEQLAQRLSLRVVLVRALQLGDMNTALAASEPVEAGSARVSMMARQVAEEEAAEYLRGIAARLSGNGLDVGWEVVRGDSTARAIAGVTEEHSNNIIALASHSRSGVMRWVMGSVAEQLLRSTESPVLVVPAAVAGREGE